MASVFKHLKYQSALSEIFQERKASGLRDWSMRKLAEQVGIQPSFLTNVLKERFDFNSDQLYSICLALDLSVNERKYLELLLEHQRCQLAERRRELRGEIDEVRSRHQKTEKHISAKPVELSADSQAKYYLDPFVQLVHVHLSLPPFDQKPEELCAALGVSRAHLAQIFEVLTRIGYIKNENGRYRVISSNKHLPKSNPLCDPHQALMRLKSIDQLSRLKDEEKYSFSVTLSGTDETRAQLQEEFLAFLKRAEAIVKPAESKKAFQMNFDLFSWLV